MTIPAAPLPTFALVLQALRATVSDLPDAFVPRGYVPQLHRDGRQALAEGVRAVGRLHRGQPAVLVPAYICREALDPLRAEGIPLRFYEVGEDLAPHWEGVAALLRERARPRVFVLVHYFGRPGPGAAARRLCAEYGAVLLEDGAHLLRPGPALEGELAVFSFRKVLPVPGGGLLLAAHALAAHLDRPSAPSDRVGPLVWLARKAAQGVLLRAGLSWHALWIRDRNDARPPALWSAGGPGTADPLSPRLLSALGASLDDVASRRRAHYARLLGASARWPGTRPLWPDFPAQVTPYAFPLIVERGSAPLVRALVRRGIPAGSWPDLPPEVEAAGEASVGARALRDRLMLLPVHQSLRDDQLDAVIHAVRQALPRAT